MSMTVSSSTTSLSYSLPISRPSFKDILKVIAIAGAFFLTGITPASASQVTVYPATLPDFCARRDELYKHGYPFYPGIKANVLCYLDSVNYLEAYAKSQQGEDRLLADYNFGKRQACPFTSIGPSVMSGEQSKQLSQKVYRDNLQGLAHMYNSGCLEIAFPEKGETFQQFYERYMKLDNYDSMHYKIEGCWYFVKGALICPDKDAFEKLKYRFLETV